MLTRLSRGDQLYRLRIAREANEIAHALERKGLLVRGPCETCGTTHKIHGHHDDYRKPHVVRWLCQYCHSQWHTYNDPIYPPHYVTHRYGKVKEPDPMDFKVLMAEARSDRQKNSLKINDLESNLREFWNTPGT